MATFNGTGGNDSIRRTGLSAGVGTDPAGVTGTLTGESNLIYGNGGNDRIEAGDGDGEGYFGDTVYGGAGNDTVSGGAGYDSLYGDDGNDVIEASDSGDYAGDDLAGGAGNDTLTGGLGPNLLSGGGGNDVIRGGALASEYDLYDGGAGNDVIYAADNLWNEIDGGAGADEMHGGKGDDHYYVDDAGDRVVEGADGGHDVVFSFIATMTLAKNVDTLFFSVGTANVRATGNGDGYNRIETEDGDDIIDGRGGADFLFAYGGADTVYGGAGDDYLEGGAGADKLCGGSGKDELVGGFDADRLYGGKGNDVFNFHAVTDSTPMRRDVIAASDGVPAFEGAGKATGDRIFLAYIDADATDDAGSHFVFGGTGKGHLSLVNSGHNTIVRGNVDDDRGFELQIVIEDGAVKASAYTAADFVLDWV